MKTKLLALGAVALLAGGSMSACGGNARPTCLIGHFPYAVNFVPKTAADETCATNANHPKGDVFSVAKFNPPNSTTHRIFLKPLALYWSYPGGTAPGNRRASNPNIVSGGALSATEPNAQNLCTVPTFESTSFRDVDPATAGNEIEYAFSNLQFHVTALTQGTQFQVDLALTRNGATCNYTAFGVSPAVTCNTYDPSVDDFTGEADPTACGAGDAPPDPILGLQLTPEYDTTCRMDINENYWMPLFGYSGLSGLPGVCVIDRFPSFDPAANVQGQ